MKLEAEDLVEAELLVLVELGLLVVVEEPLRQGR